MFLGLLTRSSLFSRKGNPVSFRKDIVLLGGTYFEHKRGESSVTPPPFGTTLLNLSVGTLPFYRHVVRLSFVETLPPVSPGNTTHTDFCQIPFPYTNPRFEVLVVHGLD